MNRIVVVDTSITLKWIYVEHDSTIARALLVDWVRHEVSILAPSLMVYELTNNMHQKVKNGVITIEKARKALQDIFDLEIVYAMPRDASWSKRALEIAQKFNLNAAYDAHFLVLAEQKHCEFWTADAKLYRNVLNDFPWVRLLEQYKPTE